jgi:membrane protein implicated in regulation of membrane protease activity
MRPWLAYTLVRLGLFAVAFAVLYLLGLDWWLAALLAAVVGFLLAYIFFRPLRERMAADLAAARDRPTGGADEAAEDEATSDEAGPAE